ncbi:hypothetical protein [Haloarcula laminariae]|uniref:hypothetical protein n=1 Tax=Haloarcula laminariae TaxID=2961577 RepID=UPI002405F47E|nr:hypothetical protein [Halomicroarcula sp. FL173]
MTYEIKNMIGKRSGFVGFCILVVVTFSAAGMTAGGYSITDSSAIETPPQTVSYEGQEYTIDSVSRITAGESVTITTSVPSDGSYYINLRGPENQLISSDENTGDTTTTLSYFGSDDQAGSYVATIEHDGNTVAVHPIVIAGYDISVSSPNSVKAGQNATISATVTERSVKKHSSLDRVEVVVGNEEIKAQQTMTDVGDDTYETTISTDELDSETYNVYVVVRGDESVRNKAEILGVSDTVELTVTDAETATTESSNNNGGTGNGNTNDQTATETETVTSTPTATATSTPQSTGSATVTEADSNGTPSSGTPADPSPNGGENIIAPATSTDTATSSGSGPGFTAGVAILMVLAAGLLWRQ